MISRGATPIQQSLRITLCLPVLREPGSPDTAFLLQMLIASRLKERGHRVQLAAPLDLDDVICTDDPANRSTARRTWSKTSFFHLLSSASWKTQQLLHVPYLNYFSNLRFCDAYLRCFPGQDIIMERNGVFRNAAAMACKQLDLPYVLFFDGDDLLEHDYAGRPLQGILRRRAEAITRYNLAFADRVICTSETARRRLVNTWQVPEQKIAVFVNGVDINLYHPSPETVATERAELGAGEDPLVVFVSSFYPWHDIRALLQAFALVRAEVPTARLMMVGDGPRCPEARALASELGLDSAVIFTGFLPQAQVSRLVNAADVAVAPYEKMDPELFIGSPMKLFEYMAAGKAVVASDMGQITEVIRDGASGVLVEPGSAEVLAAGITRLIRDPALREQMGGQARLDAVEKYSWDQYIQRLVTLFEDVIAEKKAAQARRNGKG